ncbi:MAG: isoaspartyl peptidase/L-asparaginase [Flavobacteriales bacterium]|nr:isoaspartyl peptidase/L-asparaginase [Flavobacteriales bacterium]
MSNNIISIAIHGGAGTLLPEGISTEQEKTYKSALSEALNAGYSVLEKGGDALDAVETAVKSLEDCPLFNAGRGSVFTANGSHEMDASIMEGLNRNAGAVSLVQGIKNPISLARAVMEKSGHVFLAGQGAMDFAKQLEIECLSDEYFFDQYRFDQWQTVKNTDQFQLDHTSKEHKFGTVGAVACDIRGNLAAATSTGGMTNKKFGRVGDSPLIGCGNYANNQTCAVSCTGSGEYFIRSVVAYEVSALIEFKNLSLEEACAEVIHKRLPLLNGDGGLIAVDSKGNFCMPFNTAGMYRAAKNNRNVEVVAIFS